MPLDSGHALCAMRLTFVAVAVLLAATSHADPLEKTIEDELDQTALDPRADSPQLLHSTHGFILLAYRPDLLIELTHAFIKGPQIRVQPGKQRSHTHRQSIARILQPHRNRSPQSGYLPGCHQAVLVR